MISVEEFKKNGVYIYGVGRIGKKACALFEFMEIPIKGFLVSDIKGCARKFHGIDIKEITDARLEEKVSIIVTVPQSSVNDVIGMIEKTKANPYLIWEDRCFEELWLGNDYSFIDRRRHKEKVLFILCGYKDFLWQEVFGRVKKYVLEDIEICLCSSGLYSEKLNEIAAENNWSYLSTAINSLTLVQNIAFSIYKDSKWIYKMDEDIFITKDCLRNLYLAYENVRKDSPYHVGVMAPLIPLNEYGARFILERYGCIADFESRFGKLYFGGDGKIINTKEIAPYMWGRYGKLPDIDTMAKDFENSNQITACATRFNIGLILFERMLWTDIKGFTVSGGTDLGSDEEEICSWCVSMSRPILVAHNAVAGHFSFGPQEAVMKDYLYK